MTCLTVLIDGHRIGTLTLDLDVDESGLSKAQRSIVRDAEQAGASALVEMTASPHGSLTLRQEWSTLTPAEKEAADRLFGERG
jgi:hypothetical protein